MTEIVSGVIGAGIGSGITILANTVIAKWKTRWDEDVQKRMMERNAVLNRLVACGKLINILGTMHARGSGYNSPYSSVDKKDFQSLIKCFHDFGHLLSDDLQNLYYKALKESANLGIGHDPRAPVLEEMHTLAKSEYSRLERQYSKIA